MTSCVDRRNGDSQPEFMWSFVPWRLWLRFWRARTLAVVVAWIVLVGTRPAQAEPMREFLLSCSYGVLAGTIVGAATLAFSDQPGDNLYRIARGASVGLYSGILLGFYVVYGVHSETENPEPLEGDVVPGNVRRMPEVPRLLLQPLITERGIEGGAFQVSVLRF